MEEPVTTWDQVLPKEREEETKVKNQKTKRKIVRDSRKHLQLRCLNILKLARRLKVEKARANDQVIKLKQELARQLSTKQFAELEKSMLIDQVSQYASINEKQRKDIKEFSRSEQSRMLEDKLLINDLEKRTQILTTETECLRLENQNQSNFLHSAKKLLSEVFLRTANERKNLLSNISKKIEEENLEIEKKNAMIMNEVPDVGDINLITKLAKNMNNEIAIAKINFAVKENDLTEENKILKEKIRQLESEKWSLSQAVVELESNVLTRNESEELGVDPSQMTPIQVKKLAGSKK